MASWIITSYCMILYDIILFIVVLMRIRFLIWISWCCCCNFIIIVLAKVLLVLLLSLSWPLGLCRRPPSTLKLHAPSTPRFMLFPVFSLSRWNNVDCFSSCCSCSCSSSSSSAVCDQILLVRLLLIILPGRVRSPPRKQQRQQQQQYIARWHPGLFMFMFVY